MDEAAETHLVDGRPYWGSWGEGGGFDKLYFCKKYAIPEEIGSEVFDVNVEELALEDDRFKEDIDKETEKEVFYTSEKVRELLRTDEGLIKLSDIWRSSLQTFHKDEGVKINYHKWRDMGTLCGIQTFTVGRWNQFWIRGENVNKGNYKSSYGLPDMFEEANFRDYHFYLHCIIYSLFEGKGDWSKESVVGADKGLLDFFWGIYRDRILESIEEDEKRVYEESGKIAAEIRDKWIELWNDHRNIGLLSDDYQERLVVRLPVILSFGLHNEYKSLSEPQKVRLSKLLFESFRRNVDDLTSTFITSNSSDREPGEFERQMRKQYGVMYLDFIFDFNVESELRLITTTTEVTQLTGKDYKQLFSTLRPKPETKELPDGTTQKIYPDIPTIKDGRQTSGIEKRIATYLNDRGYLVITEPMIDFPNPDMNYKLPDLMVMDKGRTLAIEIDDISHLIDYETREGTWGNANIKKWKTDRKMDEYLLCLGIPMLRVWKFDVERSPEIVVEKVARIFESLGGMRMTYR